MRPPRLAPCLLAALAALPGCIASNTLEAKDRAAPVAPAQVAWAPATRADVLGFHESEQITGEAAATLRKVYYAFADDGTWTAAALVQEASHPAFQTLSGRWTLDGSTLRLGDDAPPARAFAGSGRLRLDSEGGSVVFRRGTE